MKIDGLTDRQILIQGTTKGVSSLTDAQYDRYLELRENQNAGTPNFSTVRKYTSGGVVRGSGAAVRGTKFKGIF